MNLKIKNYFKSSLLTLTVLGISIFLGAPNASALSCASGICPDWSKDIYKKQTLSPNSTILEMVQIDPHLRRKSLQDRIVDPGVAAAFRARCEAMYAAYEYRKNYSLSHPLIDQKNYIEQNSHFTQYVVRQVFSKHVALNLRKIRENNPNVLRIARSYDSVGKFAKGSGKLVDTTKTSSSAPIEEKNASSVDDAPEELPEVAVIEAPPEDPSSKLHFQVGTKTNIPQQKGQVWVESDIINGSVEFQVGQPWGIDPWQGQDVVNINPNEDYQVGFSRKLFFGFDGGVSYGGTSTRMVTSLGKNISSHIRAEAVLIRGIDPVKASLPEEGERQFRVNYGIAF